MPTRTVSLAAALSLCAAAAAPTQQPTPPAAPAANPPGDATRRAPEKPTLEDILAAALRHNPDIRVAEAKLREAEAELNRVRLSVIQKMTRLHQELQHARAEADQAEKNLARLQELKKKGYVAN